jgi:hypothetical protein
LFLKLDLPPFFVKLAGSEAHLEGIESKGRETADLWSHRT